MSAAQQAAERDPFAAELALRAPEPLAALNREGILLAADIHVALTLTRLAGVSDPVALRCAALTVAAARQGHTFLQLDDTEAEQLHAFPSLVASADGPPAPLRLAGTRLYLDRYWREERRLAAALLRRDRMRADPGELAAIGAGIRAAFAEDEFAEQRTAAAVVLLRQLAVIAGGPGTGKTTAVTRIVELTAQLAAERGSEPPLVALCAPTGKAAARLQQAGAAGLRATTIHRLLGWLPGGRFRHDAANRLPHDLVIVDETSMVPLTLMVALAEAVRDDAQLVLVGDPDQLAAIEVGAVLADIVGPAAEHSQASAAMRAALASLTGDPAAVTAVAAATAAGARDRSSGHRFGDGVVVLRRGHRSAAPIGVLAEAIRRGDGDATIAALRADAQARAAITWIRDPLANPAPLRAHALAAYLPMIAAARAGDAGAALAHLSRFRLLCAHRHGPLGVTHWTRSVEMWLQAELGGFAAGPQRYPGLPLVVTRNDPELHLYNGDSGVVVADAGGGELRAVFASGAASVQIAPSRLADVEPLFAQTVHKSQGSEFDVAAVLLPEPGSPLLTRELLYTAVTRARHTLVLAGSEQSVREALARPAGRASALRELLWAPTPA